MAISTAGTLMSAKAQRDQGKYQQQMANRNAAQLEEDAVQAQLDAIAMAKESRRQGRRLVAREKAKMIGKSGVEFRGSPLEAVTELVGDLELRSLEIERHGQKTATNRRIQAANTKLEGYYARKGSKLASTGTILQGVSNVVGQYQTARYNISGFAS